MPRTWHDRHAVNKIEDTEQKEFYRSIVADKKPYFMRYIYPDLMKQYKTYIRNTNINSLRQFQITAEEMNTLPVDQLSDQQLEFLRLYRYSMPVGVGDCVVNKICRRFEEEFDGIVAKKNKNTKFDYSFMCSDATYSYSQAKAIETLYKEYNKRLRDYKIFASNERVDEWDARQELIVINEDFRMRCDMICPNEKTLCDIMLNICYKKEATKRFAWNLCGDVIIDNLLRKNGNRISFPTQSKHGDIEYCGKKFAITSKKIGSD